MNQKKRKKPLVKNPYRKFFQWGVLAILAILALRSWFGNAIVDWEAYCPFGGLSAFFRYSYAETLACTMTTVQIFMGIMLFIGVLLLAKLFCGYICPLGTVGEWLGKIGKKMNMRFEITGIADKALRSLKYILLFLTLYFTIRSGELFCKTYDPYFAVADGFGHDVVTLYALIAIGLLLVGSIFIRMFFCRYLCPLGAISNVFTYFGMFALAIILFIVLNIIGIHISWVWLLGTILLLSYIMEITRAGRKIFPVFAITRDNTFCKDCSLCDKACPQGIKITSYKDRVSHPDCTMCGECLQACPRTDSIGINGKKNIKWFPAVALALLIAIGFGLGRTMEVPTIDEQWGTDEQHARSEVYYQDGIDRVTCYGSSRAFSNQLHKVDGIIGVGIYVANQRVRVEYDPSMINESGIREAIFVPYSSYVNRPGPEVETISYVDLAIDNFMNKTDFTNFGRLLSEHEGVYAFETMYGEPVITVVYFDEERFDPALLPGIVETKEVTYEQDGQSVTQQINFHFDHMEDETGTITPLELEQKWFRSYTARFNGFDARQPEEIATYLIDMPQAKDASLYRWLSYMMSHLSVSGGFVGFDTKFTGEIPEAEIRFLPAERTAEEVFQVINTDSLHVRFSDGREQKFVNPFTFEEEGIIIE